MYNYTAVYKICGSQAKIFYTPLKFLDKPKLSGGQCQCTCKVFLPLPGVPPANLFVLIFFWQKILVCFFLYWCFYPHWSRDSLSPVGGIFKNSLSEMEVGHILQLCFNWQTNCTSLFTHFKNNTQLRQSCDKIHCIPT